MNRGTVLVTGASGVLGWSLCRFLSREGFEVIGTYNINGPDLSGVRFEQVALEDEPSVLALLKKVRPTAVVHAAAMTSPDDCEREPERCLAVNVTATRVILENCPAAVPVLLTSTDLVFDGLKGLYSEEDSPSPVNHYGRSKVMAEHAVFERSNSAVLRIAKLYSNGSPFHPCFTTWMEDRFERDEEVRLFEDQFRSPIWVGDVARAVARVLTQGIRASLYHLGGPDRLSRLEFGRAFAEVFGYDERLIRPIRSQEAGLVLRGSDCSLRSDLFYRDYGFVPSSLSEGLRALKEGLS